MKAHELSKVARDLWTQTPANERESMIAESTQYLEERRDAKKTMEHNVALHAFHDTRATLDRIELQVSSIHPSRRAENLI